MSDQTNPLLKHFRQPSIYIKLPSAGQYWKDGSLDLPISGEVPVMPMTAIDEITLRTPDGLLNGESTTSVIQSCIPNIKNAWNTPAMDIDAILLAIRIASYGHNMEITSTCPECKDTSDFEYDLRNVSDALQKPDYSKPLVINDVTIMLRPMTYREVTDNNSIQVEERKVFEINSNQNLAIDDKLKQINAAFLKITDLSINAIAKSIVSITIGDSVATKTEHIAEYLKNCDSKVYSQIRKYIGELKQQAEVKPIHITCPACGHQYDSPFILDLSNFFE